MKKKYSEIKYNLDLAIFSALTSGYLAGLLGGHIFLSGKRSSLEFILATGASIVSIGWLAYSRYHKAIKYLEIKEDPTEKKIIKK